MPSKNSQKSIGPEIDTSEFAISWCKSKGFSEDGFSWRDGSGFSCDFTK
jgi:hypothetical protein